MTHSDMPGDSIRVALCRGKDTEIASIVSSFADRLAKLTGDLVSRLVPERRVLVVGGAGYVGSVLVRKLLSVGAGVTVLDSLLYDHGSAVAGLLDVPGFSFIRGDLCDAVAVNEGLNGATDVVLLAALVGDPMCKKYPDLARRVNHDGAIRLIDSLVNRNIDKVIFLSTCSNYGLRPDDSLATEESELNPKSLYAETKVAVEQYLAENASRFDFCPIVLRAATAYGASARMRFDLTVSEFTRTLAMGAPLLVYDENTWRPYCHVSDIADAIAKVLSSPAKLVCGEVFNVGSTEENYTKKTIVDIIRRYTQSGSVEYKVGGFDPRNYRVSFDKIATGLGFKNRHSVGSTVPNLIRGVQAGLFDDVELRKWLYGNYEVRIGAS
jgi:nucleoside-diphosphate-sugar epimerase